MSIFLFILNKWAKFFHLIYNSCRFVQTFQTDNTLSDKIAILTKLFELICSVAPTETISLKPKSGVGRLSYILILLQNRLDWRSQRFLKIAARFVKNGPFWRFFALSKIKKSSDLAENTIFEILVKFCIG